MKLPIVLIDHTLKWEHANTCLRYRLVAREWEHGFEGISYEQEQWKGIDALGNDIWLPLEVPGDSLFIAAMAQAIFEKKYNDLDK
jgi:hypothetical protein